jgi:hypothetical protein
MGQSTGASFTSSAPKAKTERDFQWQAATVSSQAAFAVPNFKIKSEREFQMEAAPKKSRAYALKQRPSRLKKIVEALPARRQIMIIREVLSPPKGFQ